MKSFVIICSLIIAFISGYYIHNLTGETNNTKPAHDLRAGGYTFINPLLECNNNEILSAELRPFKAEIENYIEEQKKSNNIDSSSVYFRDLNNGPWFGINENELMSPASLLKVPIMMSAYKKAEDSPGYLNKNLIVSVMPNYSDQNIQPEKKLMLGDDLTIDDLVNQMIVYSDNIAAGMIKDDLGYTRIMYLYSDLGLTQPESDKDWEMSIKDNASFYRILYNASYLNKNFSEKALGLLAQTKFKNGVAGGVPQNIKVAHKFGERRLNDLKILQFHDCGIVYYPKNPYILCVMTKGDHFELMENFITGLSKIVYQNVNNQKSK